MSAHALTMDPVPVESHGKNGRSLPPAALDAIDALSGGAHADAEPNAKQAARRHGTGLRTQYNWRTNGPQAIRDAQLFLSRCMNPFRYLAGLRAAAARADIEGLSRPDLIAAYREVLQAEKRAESEDTCADLGAAEWLDRALACERDAALDLRKAAILRRFAELRITDAEVRG